MKAPVSIWNALDGIRCHLHKQLTVLFFGHKLDPVAFMVLLYNLARAVGFVQASGWVPLPHPRDAPWREASEVFPYAFAFWNAIMRPEIGLVWVTTALTFLMLGILTGRRGIMLIGVLVSLSFWFYVVAAVWQHLGFLCTVNSMVPLFGSAWVFDYVYRRQQERVSVEQEVEASAQLVGSVTEIYQSELGKLQNALTESRRTISQLTAGTSKT